MLADDPREVPRHQPPKEPAPVMALMRIEANVAFRAYRNKDGIWAGVCDPLGLTVEGESWSELLQNIDETMNLMLRDLLKRGELNRFLRARGWSPVRVANIKSPARVRFDVPFRVTPVEANESGQRLYSQLSYPGPRKGGI